MHTLRKGLLMMVMVLPLAVACLKSTRPGIPDSVVSVINLTGFNRVELTKTIARYFESTDTLKLLSAYFLIENMELQYAVEFSLQTDSSDQNPYFNPLDFDSFKAVKYFLDSIEARHNKPAFKARRFVLDRDTLSAEILINTIELAVESTQFPWADYYGKEAFFKYVLPYRIGNEMPDNWRLDVLPLRNSIKENSVGITQPRYIAEKVNKLVDSLVQFDKRMLKMPNEQKISELLSQGFGSQRDINYFKAKLLRSLGIPSAVDYVPYLADSLHAFYFAVFMDVDGLFKAVDSKAVVEVMQLPAKVPKVYRRVFYAVENSLFALKSIEKPTPPYLGHYHYTDVTGNYVPVRTINYTGFCPDTLIYISVFNDGKWRAVDWSVCKDNQAVFSNFSIGPAYEFTFIDTSNKLNVNSLIQMHSSESHQIQYKQAR